MPAIGRGVALGRSRSGLAGVAEAAFLPIPGGDIIGSILGGLLGNLLTAVKKGSASLSLADGQLAAGAATGNSGSRREAATGAIGSVAEALNRIAEQFGGTVSGAPSVSIGVRGDNFRVDTQGQNRTSTRNPGVVDFGDNQAAAISFATLDALKDGVIAGLSDKVASALQSSTDLTKAVNEALKVQELETLLGGVGAAARKAFADFERQARDRLRIASRYGFDLVELERVNAEERKKLLQGQLQATIAPLQSLLDNLSFGDRAAGTAVDRRVALQGEVTRLTPLAQGGDADATNKLANVLSQLEEVSQDVFGTTGGYAEDRSGIVALASQVVQETTERLRRDQEAAQQAAQDATVRTAALAEENNSQNARLIASMERVERAVTRDSGATAAWSGSMDFGTRNAVRPL